MGVAVNDTRLPKTGRCIQRAFYRRDPLLGGNTRAAALFDVRVEADASGFAQLRSSKLEAWREWARSSEGC